MDKNGCECCCGDEALYYVDSENCAFIDSDGEMMVTVNERDFMFRVKYCPNCGMKFDSDN